MSGFGAQAGGSNSRISSRGPIQIQTKPPPSRAGYALVFLAEARRRARRLGGHVDDIAFDVEFPAVVQAAQAAFLVAPEGERGAAMQAVLAQDAELFVACL